MNLSKCKLMYCGGSKSAPLVAYIHVARGTSFSSMKHSCESFAESLG